MHLKHATLLSAILLLTVSFGLSQLIVTRRYTSISVTIHFDSKLRFTDLDVETTYSYTSEDTVLAFNYIEPTSETEFEYEIFTIFLEGASIYYWRSVPLKIQSGGYVQHVFFDVNFGIYHVTATVQYFKSTGKELEMSILDVPYERVSEELTELATSILDELKLEFTV